MSKLNRKKLFILVSLLITTFAISLAMPLLPTKNTLVPKVKAQSVPAFPEAEGGGAVSVGGRGGRVIEVTNLNSSGPGSFRAAVQASGPRIVVFRVSGIIDLGGTLTIANPYITIAGQTAPGGGILIKGNQIRIETHDVIIRYLRLRKGQGGEEDIVWIWKSSYNIIIDHVSASWGTDENLSLWGTAEPPPHNVTWSWNLNSEGLTILHASCGTLTGSGINSRDIYNIDVHHNLFSHFNNRTPLIKRMPK